MKGCVATRGTWIAYQLCICLESINDSSSLVPRCVGHLRSPWFLHPEKPGGCQMVHRLVLNPWGPGTLDEGSAGCLFPGDLQAAINFCSLPFSWVKNDTAVWFVRILLCRGTCQPPKALPEGVTEQHGEPCWRSESHSQ